MKRSARELLDSREFRHLVSRRWTVSLVLTLALFATYYGYILLIAWNKPLLARKLGAAVTLGIPAGAAVIVVSWILTCLYVAWANREYDSEVRRLKDQVRE
jgi:uncharacterized membrane protein (DUF485 family)